MMLTLRRIAFICWLAVVGVVVPVCADEPGPPAASANPNATYVVVLRESWQMPPRTDGEGRRPVEEPDFAGQGGELKAKWRTRRVVTLPPPAVEALQKHPSVLYLQRVNTGDPGDHPENLLSSVPAPRFVAATESVPAPITSGTYQYDGAGNIIAIGNDVFTYDKVGRLMSAVTRGVPSSYKYDVAGNQIESTIGTGATPKPRPVNVASNRLANVPYDRSGNQTRSEEGTLTYQYDPLNMMVGRTGGSTFDQRYIYTADDERLGINDLAEWDWTIRGIDGKVLSEFDSMSYSPMPTINDVWHWDQDYYHREGQLTASKRVDSSGSYRFYHLDHLGTPRLITDERGYRLSENAYYPFGLDQTPWNQEIENFSNRKIDNQKFTGHERDYIDSWHVWPQESLDYMHARFYSAASGRFLSVDPVLNLKRALREPQNWNRYAYVMNNPLRYTDPDGRDHYQEPGFTKPYSEWGEALQMDENTPAVVRYSNYATGGLTALGAAGFVGVGSAATEGALQLAARFPNAFGFLLRTGVAITAGVGYGNSQEIRFTQGSIKSTFKDGRTVAGMIEGLKNGSVKPGDVAPIRVFMRDGKMFTLDNRRLYAFQQAGVKSIRVVWATAQELARELPKKLTTENDGVSAVVRGQ